MRGTKKILIVGFGDIGRRLAAMLPCKHRIVVLVRSARDAITARKLGVKVVRGDLAKPHTLHRLTGSADLVFHFAPPPAHGDRDTHTRHLISALTAKRAAMLPQQLVYISTAGVYGDCEGAWVDERRRLRPGTARAVRRVDAERTLRKWSQRHAVTLSILRAPGIYALDRLPLARIAAGLPALTEQDDVHTNHIHAEDLARAAWAAARKGRGRRCYNVVDDSDLKMAEYLDLVARFANLPVPARLPRDQALAALPPMARSFLQESRRIRNDRLKRELSVRLRYPTVAAFLAEAAAAGDYSSR
ncbi:MAG: NAD-dependent epimerase/dehydratase family protein [Betaproteobacteria bacterium]|nr:NAD-dependent epimerase/dehydratase family protein [Betaproteobacteria bacterium]